MDNSSVPSKARSPFKDITNTSTRTARNATSDDNAGKKTASRQICYARMSDEKKAEYLQKLRTARQQKKVATVSENATSSRASGQGWYARLTDVKKAEYLEKQRISRQKNKMDALSGNFEKLNNPHKGCHLVRCISGQHSLALLNKWERQMHLVWSIWA